jgi:hypothetical protein
MGETRARQVFDVWCPACGSYQGREPNWTLMSEIVCEKCGEETVVTWQTRAAKAKRRNY